MNRIDKFLLDVYAWGVCNTTIILIDEIFVTSLLNDLRKIRLHNFVPWLFNEKKKKTCDNIQYHFSSTYYLNKLIFFSPIRMYQRIYNGFQTINFERKKWLWRPKCYKEITHYILFVFHIAVCVCVCFCFKSM